MGRCLVVVKTSSIAEKEKELIAEIEKYCQIDIATTSEMFAEQKKYLESSKYLAIITFGGDGTILKTVSICSDKCLKTGSEVYIDKKAHALMAMRCSTEKNNVIMPIIFAFDYSTKGRLCTIKKSMFDKAKKELLLYLKKCIQESYIDFSTFFPFILHRKRLRVNDGVDFLNEIFIFGADKGFMSHFDLSIDGEMVYRNIRCDGIIISTDSGSTGYNFSAGGPIIASGLECLVITFVCPIDKKHASIVISSTLKVQVTPHFSTSKISAIIDGCLQMESSEFIITQSPNNVFFFTTEENPHKRDFVSSIQENS